MWPFNEKIVIQDGNLKSLYKISYQGYEIRSIFGIKYRKKVWKTKWVDHKTYMKYKHRPLVTRAWEERFFD